MRDYAEQVKGLRECASGNFDICVKCGLKPSGLCSGVVSARMNGAADAIEELLAKRTAFWVDTQPHLDDSSCKKDGMSYYCSNCHHRAGKYKHRTYRFCPWCGAKIVKKGENDDKQYQLHG